MKKFNDRMLLESLVRKYGKNGIVKAINEMANVSTNPVKNYMKYAEPIKEFYDTVDDLPNTDAMMVMPKNAKNDIERYLNKPYNTCKVFSEGHFGDKNEEAYNILYDLCYDGYKMRSKFYSYIANPEYLDEIDEETTCKFELQFCDYNGFKFICCGGDCDDYCVIL